ncbi:MAG: FkbM family methyltransferase [Vicinamibacterales bacterium]
MKSLLPDRSMLLPVCAGPFRGARIVANPRASLRKMLGLYERELNGWLTAALPRVTRLIDVGANDGYFAYGCAAAMRRSGRRGEIICFEPQPQHQAELRRGFDAFADAGHTACIVPALVGEHETPGMTTLDALRVADRDNTLIKIDVEGAELAVLAGATSWLRPSNLFLIEVHQHAYLEQLNRVFRSHGLALCQIDQRPLPILGREERDTDNRWLVSQL